MKTNITESSIWVLLFSYLCIILLTSCNESVFENNKNLKFSEDPALKKNQVFKIIKGPCGDIRYESRIGQDYESALDSLVKKRMSFLNAETNADGYYIDKDTISVDFKYDNRLFIAHGFRRQKDNQYIFSIADVIDSNGNYFIINWCDD